MGGLSPSERRWTRFRDLLNLQEEKSFLAARALAEKNVDILSPPLQNHAVQQLVQLSPPHRRIPLQDITPPPASLPMVPTTSTMYQRPYDEKEWPITSIYISPSNSLCSTLEGEHAALRTGTDAMRPMPSILPLYTDQKFLKEDRREEEEEKSDVFYSPQPIPKTPSQRIPTPNALILRSHHGANGTTPSSPKTEWTFEAIQSCTSLSQLIPLETALASRRDFPGLLRAVQSRIEVLRRPHPPGANTVNVEDVSSQSSSLVMSISTTTTIELLAVHTANGANVTKPADTVADRVPAMERRPVEIQRPSRTPWRREEQKQRQESATVHIVLPMLPDALATREFRMTPHDARPSLHRDHLIAMEERIQDYMQQNLSLRQEIHTTQVQLQRIQADRSLVIETLQSMLPPKLDPAKNDAAVEDLYRLLMECKKQWMRQQQQMVQIQNELHQSEQSQRAATAAKDKSEQLYIQATRDLRRLQREQTSLLDQVQQLQHQESRKMGEYREREQQYQRIIAEMKEKLTMAAGGENRVPMNLYRAAVREAHQYRQELQSLLMMRMNHVWPTSMGPWPSVPPMARPKTPAAAKDLRTQEDSPATDPVHWNISPIGEEEEEAFRSSPVDANQRNPAPAKSVRWNSPDLAAKPDTTPVSTPANWKRYHRTATPAASKKISKVQLTTGDTTRTPVSSMTKVAEPLTSESKENNRSRTRISLVRAAGGRFGLQQTLRQIRKSPHPPKEKDDVQDVKKEQSSYQQKLDRMRIRPRPLQEIKP
jgi:hypothetical protein